MIFSKIRYSLAVMERYAVLVLNQKSFVKLTLTRVQKPGGDNLVCLICPSCLMGIGLTNLPKMVVTSPYVPIRSSSPDIHIAKDFIECGRIIQFYFQPKYLRLENSRTHQTQSKTKCT